MARILFCTHSYSHESAQIAAQRAVNMYAEAQPPNAKSDVSVHGAPGLTTFADCGNGGPVRGVHEMGGVLYAVSGDSLFSVNSAGTATNVGTAISGSGPVMMVDNGTQLGIVNGTYGYIYTVTGGLSVITDPSYYPANSIDYADSYFIFDRPGTNQWFMSDSLDGTSFTSTRIASAEAEHDFVVSVVKLSEAVYIFGTKSIEKWANAGAANFPWVRIPGAVRGRGIIGPRARTVADDGIFFVGNDRVAFRIDDLQPVRISTHAIEIAWAKYGTVDDCHVFSFAHAGHIFVVFSFPTEGATWVYDVASGLWHERESRDANNNSIGRWRGNCAVECYGKQMIGDWSSGKIGYVDRTIYTEFGDQIVGMGCSAPLHGDGAPVIQDTLEIEMETGVGLVTGQGSDPQVMIDISDDGGRTWGSYQRWASFGALGAYRQRVRWRGLGQFQERVIRVWISDPVRRTIIKALADLEPGQP